MKSSDLGVLLLSLRQGGQTLIHLFPPHTQIHLQLPCRRWLDEFVEGLSALFHNVAHLQEAGHCQVVDQLQLRELQLPGVAGQQQLAPHLRLLRHGDLDLVGVLLQDELVPQKGRASRKHHFVTGDLQLVDANSYVTEASLVSQQIHLLQHGVPERGKAELQDHLVLGHGEQITGAPVRESQTVTLTCFNSSADSSIGKNEKKQVDRYFNFV